MHEPWWARFLLSLSRTRAAQVPPMRSGASSRQEIGFDLSTSRFRHSNTPIGTKSDQAPPGVPGVGQMPTGGTSCPACLWCGNSGTKLPRPARSLRLGVLVGLLVAF